MKVAVYTIALNEAQFVERWYESAKEADYLLIADTGSTDKTVEIAKALGITVVPIAVSPWRFDVARNAALSLLPLDIDYCISLDMDEILVGDWRKELEPMLEQGVTRPRYEFTWSWAEDGSPGLMFGGDKVHSRKGYVWKHPVHEVLMADRIEEVMGWTKLQMHHHPDSSKPRSQYLPLLALSVQEDPWNDRNAHYYARELFFHGRYEEAAQEFIRHLELPTAQWKPERAASMRYIAKCDINNDAEEWYLKAIEEAPGFREAYVELAAYYYTHQRWQECLDKVTRALDIEERTLDYLCDETAWNSYPHDLAAIASYNLGEYKDAVKHGERALEFSPNDERLQHNMDFYLARLTPSK